MRPAPLILLLVLGACAEFPALDARLTEADRAAPYPDLRPLEPLLARAEAASPRTSAEATGALAARAARLSGRAAGLRRPVLSAAETARLRRGVDTPALQ